MTYKKMPKITDDQKQVIYGTILGGSSILKSIKSKNAYLAMRDNNIDWIRCKEQEISLLSSENSYSIGENGYCRWHSVCSPLFNQYYDLFYKNGKKYVGMDVLNELRDIGLAVWFIDAAKADDNKITLNTKKYDPEGVKILNQYFDEIGLPNEIINNKVQFVDKSALKFIKIVGIHIPNFMIHKLSGFKI